MARRPPTVRLKLFADFRQVHLLDDGQSPDLGEAWTVKATEDRIAAAAGGLGLGTEQPDTVAVELAVVASEPDRVPAEHVTEASLELRSGRLVALGCTDYLPDARRISVTPGWYRVRASHSGLQKKEKIVVQLWPAPPADPKVLLRWTPPAAKPVASKPVRGPKNAKQAAQAARRGALDAALPVLSRLADGGDVAASASLAEILAFQGDWVGFVPRAEALLANPSAVRAGNVFTDLARAFRRAARELGRPELIAEAAARVPEDMASRRDATLLKDLVLPSELVSEPTPERRAAFDQAVAQTANSKRFEDRPQERARHVFALASNFQIESEVLRLWDEIGPGLTFDQALTVARWHAFRGRGEQAWSVIEGALPRFWPMDTAQVAPLVLLFDPLLSPLLTPARRAQVLATPRGPE